MSEGDGMSVYFVITDDITDDCGCGFDGCIDGTGPVVDLVFAESRSRAKFLFWRHYRRELRGYPLNEMPWKHVRLIYRGIERPEGVMSFKDDQYQALWRLADAKVKVTA